MKLWLDDERDPKSPKIKEIFGAKGDEIWVKTVEETIEYLKTGKINHISLDHDLGTIKTGMDVAKFIEGAAFWSLIPKLNWRVHSQNPVGRKNMILALKNADNYWRKKDENF
jgi:hypothetical protein